LATHKVDAGRLLVCDEKLRRDVDFPNNVQNIISRHTKGALRMLYRALGTENELGKHVWDWNRGIDKFVYKKTSSAGVRPGKDFSAVSGNTKFTYTVNGSKGLQLPFMKKVVDAAIEEFNVTGEFKLPQVINAVGLKKEFLYTAEEDDKAAYKIQDKIRYIWLSETLEFLVSAAVQGYRQGLERRGPILIGTKFSHGGAYHFAKNCHYDSLLHFWLQGDFSSYDLSLKRALLNLFASENMRYYDRNSFKGRTWHLFREFNAWVTHNLGYKLVRKPNGEWGFLEGSMGSGSYMTSHGDSWILAFIFFMWIDLLAETSEDGEDLRRDVMDLLVGIFVFGDDFVIYCLKKYKHIINKVTFRAWMEQLGMIFKELEEKDIFLSVVDNECVMVEKNVKLLQHYFVHKDGVDCEDVLNLPPVLPWKDSVRIIARAVYGNGEHRAEIDYAIAAIGNVYASHGTNARVYAFYRYLYSQVVGLVSLKPNWIYDYIKQAGNGEQLSGVLRKASITIDELASGFPSRDHLLERNVYVPTRHLNYKTENDFVI